MRQLGQRLDELSRPAALLVALVVLVAVGLLDLAAGPGVSLSIFYLVPVAYASWVVDRRSGAALAVLAAGAWLAAESLSGSAYAEGWVVYWNAGARFATFLVVVALVAALRKVLDHERQLSRVDALTGAATYRHFREAVGTELYRLRRYGTPFTLVYADVDDFKRVNDESGHAAGDELLRRIAEVVRADVREIDVVGRLGGDELAVLLPSADGAAARQAVAKIVGAVDVAGLPTLSIGAATFVEAVADVDGAISRADALMYAVKRAGKASARFEIVAGPDVIDLDAATTTDVEPPVTSTGG